MFESAPLVDVVLSNGPAWLSNVVVDAPLQTAQKFITPEEPSTLALAMVGISAVSLYAAVKGWRTSRRSLATSASPASIKFEPKRTQRRPTPSKKKRKRGAA